MGAALATQAYVHWKHLPDRPFRLLVHMALTSLDDAPKPKYFGGRDMLALALGLPEGEATSYQMVSRALRHLIDAGAVERATVGRANRRGEYFLTLGNRPAKTAPVVVLAVAPAPPAPTPSARVAKARNSRLEAARSRLDKKIG